MKKAISLFLFVCVSLVFYAGEVQKKFPVLKGPYLGQKLPRMTPEIFAPGIISTNNHEGCSGFTKDGKLFIFSRYRYGMFIIEKKNGITGNISSLPAISQGTGKYIGWMPGLLKRINREKLKEINK